MSVLPMPSSNSVASNSANEIASRRDQSTTVLPCSDLTPQLTIIVPTRNEAGNVIELVTQLERAFTETHFEILFVDDSDDNTPQVILSAQKTSQTEVRLLHRKPGERNDGLGGAVVMGLRQARAPWVCVMDGDLQHPPAMVPLLLDQAIGENADLVIGSRYQEGGNAGGLNFIRFGISQSFDTIARLAFPKQLQHVSDPMTGFFLLRKSKIDIDALHPHGFKILLEILIRTPDLRISEVPFQFGVRHDGESKADIREGVRYVQQVAQLFIGEDLLRFGRFCFVGLTGIFINLFLNFAFTETLGVHYLASAVLATQGSSLWNFILTERWVFQGRQPRWNRLYRLILFMLMNNAALTLRGPIIFTLTSGIGLHYLMSNFISIVASTLLRYLMADTWIWKKAGQIEVYDPAARNVA